MADVTRTIEIWRDPYCEGFDTCDADEVEINEGLTVLVGCNGSGKTTFLHNVRDELKHSKIPYKVFDNLHDGGHNAVTAAAYRDDISLVAGLMTASEGEAISINLGTIASTLMDFIITGEDSTTRNPFASLFEDEEKENKTDLSNERWLLFDATDSGLSIDNVIEMKGLFDLVISDAKKRGLHPFIIISANEYELAADAPCFDVQHGSYITFANYPQYRKFILDSKDIKLQRLKEASSKEVEDKKDEEDRGWQNPHRK